jgi:hypothetical protein
VGKDRVTVRERRRGKNLTERENKMWQGRISERKGLREIEKLICQKKLVEKEKERERKVGVI